MAIPAVPPLPAAALAASPPEREGDVRGKAREVVLSCAGKSEEERQVLVDEFLDRCNLVALEPGKRPKKVAIIACRGGGNGDLLFGAKLSRFVKTLFPEAQLTIYTQQENVGGAIRLFSKTFVDLTDSLRGLPKMWDGEEPYDLVIQAPLNHENFWEKITHDQAGKVLQIAEYGFYRSDVLFTHRCRPEHRVSFFSSGLDKGELGIFLHPALFDSVSNDPEERLKKLDQLSSRELQALLLDHRDPKEYIKKRALYFGYSHFVATEYLQTLMMSSDPSKDLDICLAGQTAVGLSEIHKVVTQGGLLIKERDLTDLSYFQSKRFEMLSSYYSQTFLKELLSELKETAAKLREFEAQPALDENQLAEKGKIKAKFDALVSDFTKALEISEVFTLEDYRKYKKLTDPTDPAYIETRKKEIQSEKATLQMINGIREKLKSNPQLQEIFSERIDCLRNYEKDELRRLLTESEYLWLSDQTHHFMGRWGDGEKSLLKVMNDEENLIKGVLWHKEFSLNGDEQFLRQFEAKKQIDRASDELDFYITRHLKEWAAQNIGTIEIYDRSGNKVKEYHQQTEGAPRTVRIMLAPSLPNADMITLWQASEPFTLCTGDQSLSEAISLSKVFLYEMLPHKLYLKRSLQELGKKFGNVGEFLATEDPRVRAQYLKDPGFQQQFRQFLSHIQRNYNVEERLKAKIFRALRHNRVKELEALDAARDCTQEALKVDEAAGKLMAALQ